jgi:hypothetical protein
VRSDKHPDMELNRYVLDMAYEHGASYYTDGDGLRHFKRLTSFSVIRVTLPVGWKASSITPAGTSEVVSGQDVVTIRSCGHTLIDITFSQTE